MDRPKRRLPVLNRPDEGDDAPVRRPWQWVAFGALAIVATWVPLTALAGALAARIAARAVESAAAATPGEGPGGAGAAGFGLAVVFVYGAALALGALAGGYLVGRWGPRGVGVRESALAGLAAAAVAGGITWVSFGPSGGIVLVAAMALPFAALGGRVGLRARG
jgi:hypothetical protein